MQVPPAATSSQPPVWQEIWWARRYKIAVLGAMLVMLAGILVFQNAVKAHGVFNYRLRTGYLLLTLIFLGFFVNAQLSVVNVLTFIHALLSGFRWELFLLDPMVFMLWSFVAVSMLFWGRGVFCGWLCPFGTLQELTNRLAQKARHQADRYPLWTARAALDDQIRSVRRHPCHFDALDSVGIPVRRG